ncbi:MAG TPA: amidohydrolase [Firmicutes bacterium]|nr:amidohydrolase [Candidatus Fermentithermobacillaceae bacterium]
MDVLETCRAIEKDIIQWRRLVHQYPEIGLELPRTAELVARVLSDLGIEVRERVGGWGVVGLLRGSKPGTEVGCGSSAEGDARKTIALRADMDALPVQEETGLLYASKIPGAMHACGHDGHIAMLLGAATVLSGMRDQFSGNVKFIFQPGEEGAGGARLMIEDGVLDDPPVNAIVGAHLGVLWKLARGQIGVKAGTLMAASDRFEISVTGRGGHGAAPHMSVDPVVVACHICAALQTIVSREINPLSPAVLTIGTIHAGTAHNIIPETCLMQGTVRYLDTELGNFIHERIRQIASSVASGMRAEAVVNYHYGYPPVVNDEGVTSLVAESAAKVVGPENVCRIEPVMGGEDMAYYLQRVPGTFFGIGSGNPEKGIVYPHHHPKFDIDESVLHIGTAVFVQVCLDFFSQS